MPQRLNAAGSADVSEDVRRAIVVLLLSLAADGFQRRTPEPAGPLARDLMARRPADWRTVEAPGTTLHFRKGSAADTSATEVLALIAKLRRELLTRLEGADRERTLPQSHLFFVAARDEIRELTGFPQAGFVQSSEPTGVFSYTAGYHNEFLLRHELTHLYAYQLWGQTRQSSWFVEGLAVWAGGGCQGHSNDEIAAGARSRGMLPPLSRLASRFREIPEDVAMSQAGSVVGFLIERGGLDAARALWQSHPDPGHPLGANGRAIEDAWLARIARTKPAAIDIPRVIKEGC